MRTPTEYEIDNLLHYAVGYDPVAAKKYYEEHKHLKGRKPGLARPAPATRTASPTDPRTGKTRDEIAKDARSRQRKELSERINALSDRLNKLEALIRKRETEEKGDNRKSKAKKERAAKEKDKPKTAAEKAEASREAKKYRDKHKQELKGKSHDKKSGGSSGSKTKSTKKHSVSELRSLATKVRGQIAVAKQKLAAL